MNPFIRIAEDGSQALQTVKELHEAGYRKDDIYVVVNDPTLPQEFADISRADEIGLREDGVFKSLANLFRSRGEELRSKMLSVGVYNGVTERLENELDHGRVVVIATVH